MSTATSNRYSEQDLGLQRAIAATPLAEIIFVNQDGKLAMRKLVGTPEELAEAKKMLEDAFAKVKGKLTSDRVFDTMIVDLLQMFDQERFLRICLNCSKMGMYLMLSVNAGHIADPKAAHELVGVLNDIMSFMCAQNPDIEKYFMNRLG